MTVICACCQSFLYKCHVLLFSCHCLRHVSVAGENHHTRSCVTKEMDERWLFSWIFNSAALSASVFFFLMEGQQGGWMERMDDRGESGLMRGVW